MFGRLVDMATRTLIIDLSKGTGGEPMYGMVTVQRTRATSEGTFEVLPWETKLKLFNGIATITEAVTDGSGPFYRSAYLIRVQNGYCAPRWGFMVALPDGTTPISTGDMPKVNPITGEGIYMDAQEWNALYGTLPDRVSAAETRLEQITAEYIAGDQAVLDAVDDIAAAAVDANPKIAGLESRVVTVETTAPVHQTDENLGGGFLDKSSLATDFVYRKSDGQAPEWVMDRWAPRIGQRLGISTGTEYTLHEGRVRRTNPITSRAGIFGSSTLWMAGDQLATLLQSNGVPTVYKGGKSGELGEQTAARIGAVPAKLTFPGDLIPASGSAVVTSANVPAGVYLMPYSGVISGVHGTLSATATELTFTRTTAGSSVSSPADSEMTSDIGEEYQYAVNIINIGKNGMTTRTAQETIDLIDACFDYLSSANTRVLVLGHFADSNWWPDVAQGQKLQEINAYCKNKYGPIFMDIHALITSPQVWDITGVVPTQDDLDQQVFQGYGVKPGSLSVDNGHFNTAGNNALAYLVQATIDNLHWNGE